MLLIVPNKKAGSEILNKNNALLGLLCSFRFGIDESEIRTCEVGSSVHHIFCVDQIQLVSEVCPRHEG